MRIGVTALAVLLGLAGEAVAQANASAGPGAATCAEYGERMRRDPRAMEPLHFAWGQGFMSALNLQLSIATPPRTVDLLSPSFNRGRQQDFINDYCNRNPLAAYGTGIFAMFMEMRRLQHGTD